MPPQRSSVLFRFLRAIEGQDFFGGHRPDRANPLLCKLNNAADQRAKGNCNSATSTQRRDPTPGTVENEFKEEHYRRTAYSNEHYFSDDAPGWRTDRGKIYIMLGPP